MLNHYPEQKSWISCVGYGWEILLILGESSDLSLLAMGPKKIPSEIKPHWDSEVSEPKLIIPFGNYLGKSRPASYSKLFADVCNKIWKMARNIVNA